VIRGARLDPRRQGVVAWRHVWGIIASLALGSLEDMEEPEEELETEEEVDEDEDDEEEEKSGLDPGDSEEVEASLEDMLARRKASSEDEEESVFDMAREEAPGTIAVRTVPRKADEFVCSSCRLVKHQSQLADRKRRLCRDCV
jgi:hypothetical protein